MSKKHQKAIKDEALKRKAAAEATCAEVGLGLQDELFSVGVVLNHLNVSQLNFFLLNAVNEACRRHAGLDVALFGQNITRPCMVPLCPLFDIQHLASWTNPLIATGTTACLEALASRAPIVLHYVFDLDFLHRHDLQAAEVRRAFCDPRARVITRGEDYRRLIQAEFDVRVCKTVVPNAEFDVLIRALVTELRGGRPNGERECADATFQSRSQG